ncbi:UNVERIFIED_CONTAM: hypothetical protein RMT77_009310 [Armadillidium vulgare]
MDIKSFLVLFFICLSTHHVIGDKLDDLDDHFDLDHDDDFDDHLDDLFDGNDHDDFSHEDLLEKQLLRKIEQFLPNEQQPQLVSVSHTNAANLEKSLGFGIPLIPANNQPSNDISIQNNNQQIPQSLSAPSPPLIQHEPPLQTFGVPLPAIVEQPKQNRFSTPQNSGASVSQHSGDSSSSSLDSGDISQSQLAALDQPVEQPVVIVRDSIEDYDVDIPVLVDPAPLGIDPAHQDYDDIGNNEIGGQGRQLDDGGHRSFAPNFDPFEGNFPRYALVPRTSFSCGDHEFGGYYADTEADCQVFHICLGGGLMGSFLCPNGTLFNQPLFVCDWWFNVDCSLASQSYQLNARIGVEVASDEQF